MSGWEALFGQVAEALIAHAPGAISDWLRVQDDLLANVPALRDAPRADRQRLIDARIDLEMRARGHVRPPPPPPTRVSRR